MHSSALKSACHTMNFSNPVIRFLKFSFLLWKYTVVQFHCKKIAQKSNCRLQVFRSWLHIRYCFWDNYTEQENAQKCAKQYLQCSRFLKATSVWRSTFFLNCDGFCTICRKRFRDVPAVVSFRRIFSFQAKDHLNMWNLYFVRCSSWNMVWKGSWKS